MPRTKFLSAAGHAQRRHIPLCSYHTFRYLAGQHIGVAACQWFLRSPTLLSAAGWVVDLCLPADWLCGVPIVCPAPAPPAPCQLSSMVQGGRLDRLFDPLSHRHYVMFGSWETTWLPIIEASPHKNTSALSYKNGGAASFDGCQCVRQSPKNGGQNWKQFQNIAGQI